MTLPAIRIAALSLAIALTAHAQSTPQFTDPANLRGERIQPKTGRELPIDGGQGNAALGLQQLLRKLNTRASLMLIVAHPDDEDGGMLTFYSRGMGARVADLSLTRGEGGQNAMTGDFEDALGLIRTQELLASDRYTGVDQFFGTEVDFGFSKTKEEAFRKWTHERVLYDAVRAVRLYRPLVIAAVFIGGVTDGHGQHQVSGEIAQEVFRDAADPSVFPELTREGILPWAPLKVYARVPSFAITGKGLFDYATNQYVPSSFTNYVTGEITTTPPTPDVVIHEGESDPLLTNAAANPQDLPNPNADPTAKLSYVQFARIGLGLQRSQIGPGFRNAPAGAFDVSYHLYGSRLCAAPNTVIPPDPQPRPVLSTEAAQPRSAETCVLPAVPRTAGAPQNPESASFFDGIDTSITGILTLLPTAPPELTQGLQELATQIVSATRAFNPQQPADIAPQLVHTQHQLGSLIDSLEHQHFAGRESVLHELRVKQVQLNDALTLALGLELSATAETQQFNTPQGQPLTVKTTLHSASRDPVGVFSEAVDDAHGHRNERLLAVDAEPQLSADKPLSENLEGSSQQTQALTRPFFYRTDLEQPVYQLLDPALRNAPVTPAALVVWTVLRYHETEIDLGHVVLAEDQPIQVAPPASIVLDSFAKVVPETEASTLVGLHVTPPGTRVQADLPPKWIVTADSEPNGAAAGCKQFQLQLPAPLKAPIRVQTGAVLPSGKQVHEGFRSVGYGDLPRTNFYTNAILRLVPVDLRLPPRRRVAYLPGTGDAVADNLRSIGFEVSSLTVSDLTPEHLARFDTVILGVRTYNAHPDLHGAPTQALLDFARNGGNVVVQYQISEFTAADAPFPLTLGNAEKVVDETTPVRLLDPAAPALTEPNRITPADFNGWIEERGHGFLQSWDPHYTALTETHDPGAAAEHIAPQRPQEGGLITTALGRGHWTYVAFALYRQLPEAVPGAFRLFTNLLALADHR